MRSLHQCGLIALISLLEFWSIKGDAVELLKREDVAEGECIYPYPSATSPSLRFLYLTFVNNKSPFYVPMGSQHLYRSYATYLLGRPPISQNELDDMNLRIRGAPTHTWYTTGFKHSYFVQQCLPERHLFRANCIALTGSPGTNLDAIRQTTDTLVWTDNKSSYLFVRCVLGEENDWKLLSFKPTVDPEVRERVFDKLIELGFRNTSYWAEVKYSDY